MSKTKELKSSLKKAGKEAKLSTKGAKVTKPVAVPKGKASAKPAVTKKDEKKSKKAKAPTPSESSESEEEEEEDSDGASSEDESAKVKPQKANGAAATKVKAKAAESESESESDNSSESDSSSEEEAPATKKASVPKTNGVAKKVDSESSSEEESDSSSEDDSDESDKEVAPKKANGVKVAPKDKDTSSESESSDEEEEAPAKKANGVSKKADVESDASEDDEEDSEQDSSDDSEDDEEEEAPSKKRKAEASPAPAAKKTKTEKTEASEDGPTSLFVGRLSWNIDDDWLKREFEEFGEVVGSRVVTERDTGRSKGFGYVDFATQASAKAALEAKNQTEIDGREVNVDFAGPKKTDGAAGTPRQKSFGDKIGDPTDTLFVGNLSFDATNEILKEGFEEYGTVTRVSIPTDRETGRIKGFGYVSFESIDQAKAALEACNGQDILGRPARLDYSQPRPDQGSGGFGGGRGGGGFGGRGRGGDRGGRGRGRGGDRGRGGRGGRGAGTTNRGGFGDFKGQKISFD